MLPRQFLANAPRHGSSYLEVQVAMVMLAVGMAGLYSMTVVQTRQVNRLRDMLPAADVAALNQAPTAWQRKLGVYAEITDTVTTADPNFPHVAVEVLVDNEDGAPAFTFYKAPTDPWSWISWNYFAAYDGNAHYHPSSGNVGSWCQFRADGIPPGDYEIMVYYPALSSLGSAIPHQIFDGSTLRGSVIVNQKVTTSGYSYGGRMFDSLGVFQITSGQVRVRLVDGPGGQNFLLGDSVLIRSRRILNVVSVTEDSGGATAVLETVP